MTQGKALLFPLDLLGEQFFDDSNVCACLLMLLVLSPVSSGCGGSGTPTDSGPPPPHSGSLVTLPGGSGFVEIVKKDAPLDAKEINGELAFYFLNAGNTPMSPAPTSGTLTVGKKAVTLKAEGDGLVTPAGPRILPKGGGLDGVLAVELDGKKLNIPLGVR